MSRPLRDASADDEAPTAVHPTEGVAPVTGPESFAPAVAGADACVNCGSALAPDQHYCLVCGERRGAARFSALPAGGAVVTTTITEPGGARPPRFSSATTLIAGVATLLIAMGIGVYIGGLGKSNAAPARQTIVTVGGGGGAAPTASTASTAAGSSRASGSGGKRAKHGAHNNSSAAKVVTTVKNLPPPTVTIGASGSGKGYQNHKFTGHFFGP